MDRGAALRQGRPGQLLSATREQGRLWQHLPAGRSNAGTKSRHRQDGRRRLGQAQAGVEAQRRHRGRERPAGHPQGHIVGEWYKDCDRDKTFNIYSSSKAYTSLAFGLLLADSDAGKLAGGKKLTLDTKVCNEEWLPESLPLPDPRKADITLRHLLNMACGIGGGNVPTRQGAVRDGAGHTREIAVRQAQGRSRHGVQLLQRGRGSSGADLPPRRRQGPVSVPQGAYLGPRGHGEGGLAQIGGKTARSARTARATAAS